VQTEKEDVTAGGERLHWAGSGHAAATTVNGKGSTVEGVK
jgi:hypothetical protein